MNNYILWLVILVAAITAVVAGAEETGRRYGSDNSFQGTYREDSSGNFRLYDEYGAFEGTVRPDDDGGYRRYDNDNTFEGTIDGDDAEE
jgi:hypothetical protein